MTFKHALKNGVQLLNEGIKKGPLKEALLRNQIVKFDKIGWYIPYIAKYTPKKKHNRIYSKEEYESGSLEKIFEIDNKFDVIQDALLDASRRLEKMGIRKQTINCLFINIEKNKKQFKGEEIAGESYKGSNTVVVDSLLLYDLEYLEDVVVHETAHAIWQNLNKNSKKWFINWYNENVLSKSLKEIENQLTEDQIEEIWNIFKTQERKNVQTMINKIVPMIVSRVIDSELIVSEVRNTFKHAFLNNKNLFNDEKAFKDALKKIKLGIPDEQISTIQNAQIRSIAYEKGLTPSEYATSHPEELWAETITEISKKGKVSRELKTAIYNVISGSV